ncbi:tetratricopeptide repeat protein [bacterium 210820-DFI.6.37]|nr:tetratricopeptide repeat protein [bacterium 210820-DFI.6.37]
MNIWEILKTEETKDKQRIQAAYRAQLAVTNPEDDPEGFMRLRQALEDALKAADAKDEKREAPRGPVFEDGPVGDWMEKVHQVYCHFSKRIDPAQWQQLLRDEVCLNLDTRIQVRSSLLEYMMEHFFLPQSVIQVLDRQLGLTERMDELREEFPQEFLDAVITESLREKEYPPYEFLKGDDSLPFDEYLRLQAALTDCISRRDTEKARQIAGQMEATGIESPYLRLDKAKICCQEEHYEEARRLVESLLPQYEELEDARLMKGDVAFLMEDIQTAKKEYEKVLRQDPASQWARCGMGKCFVREGRYKEANSLFCDLLEEDPYDLGAADWLKECNERYIGELTEKMRQPRETDNAETALELAWCYYQNERYEETLDVLKQVWPDETQKIEYHSLMGRAGLSCGKMEQAMEHFQQWERQLLKLPDTEENREKKRQQLPFVRLLISNVYSETGRRQEALTQVETILEDDPQNGEALAFKGQLLLDLWEFEKAVDTLTRAIELGPASHTLFLLRARAFYYLDYLSEAFDDCERSLEIYPFELTAYVYKTKILIEAGELEAAEDTLRYLEEEGVQGSEFLFLRGYIKEAGEDFREAERLYRRSLSEWKAAGEKEEGFGLEEPAEVWHHLAVMAYDEDMEDFEPVIRMINQGLEENPDYVYLIELKAEIAYLCDHFQEALELYEKTRELAPGKIGTCGLIDTVYRDLEQWDRALEFAEMQLRQTPTGYAYMRRGQVFTCLDQTEAARKDFEKAIELAPELSYPYNYMGVLRELAGDQEEALAYYEKAIAVGETEDDLCGEAYKNAANLYCRKKDFGQAARTLRRGFERMEEESFLYEMIELQRVAGWFDQAEETLKEYKKAAGLKRMSFEYNWELAHIYRDRGKLDLAFSIYDAEGVEEAGALREAGKILFYRGKYKKALKYFKKAILLLQKQSEEETFLRAEYYLWAARAAQRLDDRDQAQELAGQGLDWIPASFETELGACLPMVYKLLGGLNSAAGYDKKAEAYLVKALELRVCDYCDYSRCADALYELGQLFQQQGRKEEAMKFYRKGLETAPYDFDLVCGAKLLEKGKL